MFFTWHDRADDRLSDGSQKERLGLWKGSRRTGAQLLQLLLVLLLAGQVFAQNSGAEKARELVARGIESLGGSTYLNVRSAHSSGRYFFFDQRGRKAFAPFWDWTNYSPVKWRFQLGEGKRQEVQIYNLELGKAWKLEGKSSLEELSEKDVEDFKESVKRDMDILLRSRVDEEGMNFYYYGSDDVGGSGEFEAVEFLGATNDSVVVFFDRRTHRPLRMETEVRDRMGIGHKEEIEFSNWHTIDGVHTPLRIDRYVDGKIASQRFLEKISFNVTIPPDHFLEPEIEEKKK